MVLAIILPCSFSFIIQNHQLLLLPYQIRPIACAPYPSAMSRIIINVNPNAAPIVPMLLCAPDCDSGISSSITTYIIAPAAKDRIYGRTGVINEVRIIVKIAPIGSTIPERIPNEKAFHLDIPVPSRGIEIIAPSGKF